jgi:hypothetical protein
VRVNLTPRRPANHLVALVDHIEPLFPARGLYITAHSCPFVPLPIENTMPKIEVNKVAEILKKNEISPAILRRVIEEMNLAVPPEGVTKTAPPVKKQFVIRRQRSRWPAAETRLCRLVLQIPRAKAWPRPSTIFRSTYDFNTTKKGRHDAGEDRRRGHRKRPRKAFKEADVWIKRRRRARRADRQTKSRKSSRSKAARREPARKGVPRNPRAKQPTEHTEYTEKGNPVGPAR